jgi:RNA recognition motif-containing protein
VAKKLYVGNLPYSVDDESLHQHFSQFGAVDSAKVIMDRDSGRSKGFGFVSFMDFKDAAAALREMHGTATCYDWLVFDYCACKPARCC